MLTGSGGRGRCWWLRRRGAFGFWFVNPIIDRRDIRYGIGFKAENDKSQVEGAQTPTRTRQAATKRFALEDNNY
jgi:hypothetical protein